MFLDGSLFFVYEINFLIVLFLLELDLLTAFIKSDLNGI